MGIDRIVRLPSDQVPNWAEISARLVEVGENAVVRMIDNLPAFPNESPPDGWHELRLGLAGGMVTLRRDGPSVRCIVWGSADPLLIRSRDACGWALAAASGGMVEVAPGSIADAVNFRAQYLPPPAC